MNTTHEALREVRRIGIRQDTEFSAPATMLIRMVYDATEHAAWAHASPNHRESAPDSVMRSVVTCCYASGIFSSSDIEAATIHDPMVSYLCANHRPDWQSIRHFRRRNMAGLRLALANLFYFAGRCCNREDIGWPEHQSEADRRLRVAIQADSHALDM